MATYLAKPTPHKEAARQIRNLPPVDRATFDRLPDELKASAFLITGISAFDVLQDVKDMIAQIPEGEDFNKTLARVQARIEPFFGGNSKAAAARALIVTRAHAFRSYNAGIHAHLENHKGAFPYRKRLAVMDESTRDSHRAMDGITLPADSPFWTEHTPPDAHNCRCYVVGVTQAEADRMKREDDAAVAAGRMLPEKRRFLEGPALTQLESGILNRGMTEQWNLNREPGRVAWDPGTLLMPMEAIRQRYDADVWEAFQKWAEGKDIGGVSLWQWLEGTRPAGARPAPRPRRKAPARPAPAAPAPAPAPAAPAPAPAPAAVTGRTAAEVRQIVAPFVAEIQKARKARASLAEIRRINQEALAALEIPAAARKSLTVEPGNAGSTVKDLNKRAVEILAAVVHPANVPTVPVKIVETQTDRAGMDPRYDAAGALTESELEISDTRPLRTHVHELTHHVECGNPHILKASLDFRAARTKGESPKRLADLYPAANYGRREITLEDEWEKKGGSHYAGKVYGGDIATELLTMGMERLVFTAAEFAADDPEYFAWLVATIQTPANQTNAQP